MTDDEQSEIRGSRRRSQWTTVPGWMPEPPDESSHAAAAPEAVNTQTRRRVVRYSAPVVVAAAAGLLVAAFVGSKGPSTDGRAAAQGVATQPTVVISLISGGGGLSVITPTGLAGTAISSPSANTPPTAVAGTAQAALPTGAGNLSATARSGGATLSWTTVPHATGYYVYVRNLTHGQTAFSKLPYELASSPWTAGLLVNGDTYQFQLQSMNGSEVGGMSNLAKVLPSGPVPGGVTDLAATPVNGGATLTWTKVANASGYLVYQKDVTRGQTAFSQLPYPLAGGPWTAGLMANGDTYQFQLRSTNGDEAGGLSNIVTVVPVA